MSQRASTLLLLPVMALLALVPVATGEVNPPDPHGDPKACLSCHEPGQGDVEVGPALPVVPTCRGCHPTADMHPVSIPAGDLQIPAGWPLEDGLLTCSTCHFEPAHGGVELVPPPYHRGGPYNPISAQCYQCHERTSYQRSDPHHPEDPQDDGSCAACHQANPEAGAAPAQARLREAPEAVCTGCHEGTVHAGVEEHVGKLVTAEVRATLPEEIVLGADGAIHCFSCHDVHVGHTPAAARRFEQERPLASSLHQELVQGEWKALHGMELRWPGTDRGEHPSLLALPARDGALCKACHGDGP